jgi:uncharacterized iron-regulated protein
VATLWGCKDGPAAPDTTKKDDSLRLADSLHRADSLSRRADSIRVADSLAEAARIMEFNAGVLCDLTQNVIIPTLQDFELATARLRDAITALDANRTDATLEAARAAWLAARTPWERSEAFLFGPAKSDQLDPAIDSWPVDLIIIDSMFVSRDQFTEQYFAQSEGSVKGMHGIEYMLWGDRGNKTYTQITPRELQYLKGAAAHLHTCASLLLTAWMPAALGGHDYASHLCNAGKPTSLYFSQKAAIAEYVSAILSMSVELSDAKLGIPYAQQSSEFEESRFSGNSKADFTANVLGIQSIYTGTYGSHAGRGLRDLVAAQDPALDARVRQKIDMALVDIGNITPSFSAAIFQNRASIQAARQTLTSLYNLLDDEVVDALGLR